MHRSPSTELHHSHQDMLLKKQQQMVTSLDKERWNRKDGDQIWKTFEAAAATCQEEAALL